MKHYLYCQVMIASIIHIIEDKYNEGIIKRITGKYKASIK